MQKSFVGWVRKSLAKDSDAFGSLHQHFFKKWSKRGQTEYSGASFFGGARKAAPMSVLIIASDASVALRPSFVFTLVFRKNIIDIGSSQCDSYTESRL